MLFISDSAKIKISQLIETKEPGKDWFVRVSVKGGGCSGLSYDLDFDHEMQSEDQVFEDKGVKMVTDLRSFLYLVNTTLEFTEGLNGKGFHFSNPNASRTCACGESFSV